MSKLAQDGTAEPVSRDQILRRKRGQRIIHFPCSAADHEQDWQPCPVVMAIYTNIALHTHNAVVKHINIYAYYTATVNHARMYMSPNKKCTAVLSAQAAINRSFEVWDGTRPPSVGGLPC